VGEAAPAADLTRPRLRFPLLFWSLIAFSLLAIVAGAWLLFQQRAAPGSMGAAAASVAESAEPAVDFQLSAADGGSVRLSDLRGQVVLVNFWATWCPPCRDETPDLQALYAENGAQHKFTILGVDVEEDMAAVQAFKNKYGVTYPLLADSDGKVTTFRYFVRSLPTSLLIDRAGNVRYRWIGQQSRAAMLDMLRRVW
jgi:peroxiredoxin